VAFARCSHDFSVGRDQRQLTLERFFGSKQDAQRRAFPWRDWRRQDREISCVFAAGGLSLRIRHRDVEDETRTSDQQQCRCGSTPACEKQLSPHP
jgi:hypothetical protein